jgi:hypothetical protein
MRPQNDGLVVKLVSPWAGAPVARRLAIVDSALTGSNCEISMFEGQRGEPLDTQRQGLR